MNVLVLDGNQNQAVASVRSLARAGHTVFAGEAASWSKAGWSRSSSGMFRYPSPQGPVDAFVQSIATFVRERPGTLVLPMTEATTLPLSTHRDFLISAGARLILPDHSDLLRAFDKNETTRLAASLGVAVPKTVVVTDPQQARAAAQSMRYPVVLKPHSSEELSSDGRLRTTGRPRYASNSVEYDAAYREISSRSLAVLVQEFVEGEGTGYFALMHHGELRAEFAHRRIRDVYPTGSGSAVRTSVPVDPEIRRASLAILSALRWHGVAMVEYRKKAGSPAVFMEVNGRFWHSLPLACYAGVDFPALLARMAEQGDVEPSATYRYGVRCRWLLGDARHLFEVWKGPPRGYPGKYPGRLRTLLQVLTPVPGTYHDLFQWRDPLPELGDWLNVFTRLITGDR
ncbi:MAG TPA: ATP-grasp domain-containing protein [Candidatus Sulfotelmatobacter sp.]|jgi:predicted ATP-grasp superfamily ATP-dependent carboligase|nr:ATP-grasp domain-containing protein [Candidatus Sulfotelmatobacter sp.]